MFRLSNLYPLVEDSGRIINPIQLQN